MRALLRPVSVQRRYDLGSCGQIMRSSSGICFFAGCADCDGKHLTIQPSPPYVTSPPTPPSQPSPAQPSPARPIPSHLIPDQHTPLPATAGAANLPPGSEGSLFSSAPDSPLWLSQAPALSGPPVQRGGNVPGHQSSLTSSRTPPRPSAFPGTPSPVACLGRHLTKRRHSLLPQP